jgi:hypothetical protein
MKRLVLGATLFASVLVVPVLTVAQVNISVSIGLPPPIVFAAPPEVIVLPDTDDVYVTPDVDVDLFFWNGWWWRLWDGHWYRSRYYDRDWVYYNLIPRFYYDVDPSWRAYYRDHDWRGHRWDYDRIPDGRLRQNWQSWRGNGYWQRQRTWGVEGYRPLPPRQRQDLRSWRQQQSQGPQVQQHEPQRRQPQVQPTPRPQERAYQPQRQEQRPRVQQRGQEPQRRIQAPEPREQRPQNRREHEPRPEGRPEKGEGDRRR